MKKANLILFWLFLLIPVILVFKPFFSSNPLAWGDAPYFSPQGLKELISEPLAFTNRGIGFGGANLFIFLSPIMILYGILGSILKLGNDLTIRILFYFPSVVFSITGTYFLTRYLGKSKLVSFFTTLVYTLNTYFILLVDGGQVGFALAYGIFPFAVLFLKKFLDKPTVNKFMFGLISLFICSVADPRVAILSFMTVLVWGTIESLVWWRLKNFVSFPWYALLGANWLLLSAYWIVPLIKNQTLTQMFADTGFANIKLIDSFVLFSPHWPANIFGQTNSPLLYFLLVPVLIAAPYLFLLIKGRGGLREFTTIVACYFLFCILTISSPIIAKIPFGFAFRDTSKFFIPVVLFAGLSIGTAAEIVNKRIFTGFLYLYLLILVWQAIFGHMNFVLSGRLANIEVEKANKVIDNNEISFRTLWVPERHPLAFDTVEKPAMDGQSLINYSPFSYVNAGEDPFNFLNSDNYADWFGVFNIKYILLSDSQRSFSKTTPELNNWQNILNLVSENKNLQKVEEAGMPVYKINNVLPRIFAVKKIYGVVGKPLQNPFIPAVNYEDGLFDPNLMKEIDNKAYSIIFNEGNKDDLAMSFLQKYFKGPGQNSFSGWATYSHSQYLKYKYELLTRDVKFDDLDYQRGIAFSTQKGEQIRFNFDVKEPGDYVFAARSMNVLKGEKSLSWKFEDLSLPKGTYQKSIINEDGFEVLNVVALIPRGEFDANKSGADKLVDNFLVSKAELRQKALVTKMEYKDVVIENSGTLKYKVSNPGDSYWVVFSDGYDPLWQLRTGTLHFNSYPIYSVSNVFYITPNWSDMEIEFKGQENVRWGIYVTTVVALLTVTVILIIKSKNKK